MGSVEERLTRKIGPLPVWVWAAVVLGGYYLYHRHQNSTGAASTATNQTGSAADGTGASSYVPPFDAASGATGGLYGTPGPATITNNYYYKTPKPHPHQHPPRKKKK